MGRLRNLVHEGMDLIVNQYKTLPIDLQASFLS